MSIIIPKRGLLSLLSLCLKKYSVFLQPPRLAATPPYIFRAENTWGETVTVRDIKIAPTEIFCGAMLALKGIFFTTVPPWQLHRY